MSRRKAQLVRRLKLSAFLSCRMQKDKVKSPKFAWSESRNSEQIYKVSFWDSKNGRKQNV